MKHAKQHRRAASHHRRAHATAETEGEPPKPPNESAPAETPAPVETPPADSPPEPR
jgi:hypothetical protein